MYKLVRTASLELQTLDSKQVVKVAGVLNKLKNYLKQLSNDEYANSVDLLRSDSIVLQSITTELNNKIKELTESISDGDIPAYDIVLEEIRDLTIQLSDELKNLNKDVKKNDPRIESNQKSQGLTPVKPVTPNEEPRGKYTREEWNDLNKRSAIYDYTSKMIKIWHPDHDVPLGTNINTPIHNFKWFNNKQIHIKQGNQDGAKNRLIEQTVKLLVRETNLSYEQAKETFMDNQVFDEFAKRLVNAIYNGVLLRYVPATPMIEPKDKNKEWIKERQIGEVEVVVSTSDFILPVYNVTASMTVGLIDMAAPINGINKLVLTFSEYSRASAGGVPPELRKNLLPKKIEEPLSDLIPTGKLVPEQKIEDVPQEKPKRGRKKKEAFRLEILKNLVQSSKIKKQAGVNPNASKELSDNFWVKFVQMCERLGAKPEDLAKVINSESSFDPHATNVQGGKVIAKGLNQLIERTARSLGMSSQEWNSYENTPAEDQLNYVEKYFKSVGKATGQDGKWGSATQLYVANFAPKYVRKASDPNTILYSQTEHKEEYDKNKGLDRNNKGSITAGDLAQSVQSKLPDYIIRAIDKAKNGSDLSISNKQENSIDGLLNNLFAQNTGIVENIVRNELVKKYLPTSKCLITVSSLSSPYDVRMKFANSAKIVLKNVIDADTSIHSDGSKIEIQCSVVGNGYTTANAIKALCDCIVKAAHIKFKGVEIKCTVIPCAFSKYAKVN
jgi:hypothetical protein